MKIFASTIGAILSFSGALFANEQPSSEPAKCSSVHQQYGYLELGVGPAPIPIPQFAGGYRLQRGVHGFDANLFASTVVEFTEGKLGLHYLYYMNPNVQKEFYFGVGPAVIGVYQRHDRGLNTAVAPEFLFGKQYISDTGSLRHFQASLIWPTYGIHFKHHHSKDHVLWYPLLSLSYGWGF